MCKQNQTSPDACTCICHEPGVRMMHIMACCHTCEGCGENIATRKMANHEQSCADKNKAEDNL